MKMIKRVPKYFDSFRCVGKDCLDNCCIGWEIEIDTDTYEFYKSVGGAMGKRLKTDIKDGCFKLRDNRCAFLNDDNLCDIITELGEERLCTVCTEYPRFTEQYGGLIERGLGMACPTAAELIFKSDVEFLEEEIEGETEEADEEFLSRLLFARGKIFDILRGGLPVGERIAAALCYAKSVQERINNNDTFEGIEVRTNFDEFKNIPKEELEKQMLDVFDGLEVMDRRWTLELENSKKNAGEYPCENTFYDKLVLYFVFRYFLKALFDCDVYSKARLAAVSFLMIRRMDAARLAQNGVFTFADRVEIAQIYSKEAEYSQDNIDALYDEFLFNDAFSLENLLIMILN